MMAKVVAFVARFLMHRARGRWRRRCRELMDILSSHLPEKALPYRPRVDGPRAFVAVFAAYNMCFPNVGQMFEHTVLE